MSQKKDIHYTILLKMKKFRKKILFLEHPVLHFFLHLLRSGNEFDQVLKHLFNLNSECEDDGFQIFPVSLRYFL